MSIYNYFCRHIIAPLSDVLLQRSIFTNLSFLEESQFWDRNTIVEYQNKRLRFIVNYAYSEIPYYKNLYDSFGVNPDTINSIYDLHKLPIIRKKDIREIVKSRNKTSKQCIKMSSSGSTAEPLQYFIDSKAYSMNYASGIRGWQWMGYKLGDKYLKLSQQPRKKITKKLQDTVLRSSFYYLNNISESELEDLYNQIIQYAPKFFRSYSDPLLYFSRFIEENGLAVPKIKAINTTGNTLFPEAREIIEKVFKTPVFDHYSCEGSARFSHFKNREGYYAADEYAISEIIGENKDGIDIGEKGRLITTDLWNTETPFIRYDTQDIVTKGSKKIKKSRDLTFIEKIDGRDCDILITPDQRLLILHSFTIYFSKFESIEQFKVKQESVDEFVIFLKVNNNFNNDILKNIHNYWSNEFGLDSKVSVELVNEIGLRKSGKRRFLERNPSIEIPL